VLQSRLAEPARLFGVHMVCACLLMIAGSPAHQAFAQGGGGRGAPPGDTTGAGRGAGRLGGPPPIPRGVLGDVPMTAADSAAKAVVERLDFDNYKRLIKGLTQFGDRLQGTQRNVDAMLWIEAQLKSWGYTVERIKYEYRGRNSDSTPQPREEVYATKVGSTAPQEMYILGGHMDGRGGGEAANDDGSGTALVMEIARVLAAPDVRTTRSVRFALWNNEESGLNGASAYAEQRKSLQGVENPRGSGKYPEPKWLGMIQHDMMMWDHGNPVQFQQVLDADVDIEFQLNSAKADESAALALKLLNANRMFATDYPAAMSNAMSATDSRPFQDLVAAVSLRENRRLYETGRRANPTWHQPIDLYVTFSDADFRLGFNAMQTTLGTVAKLVEARIAPKQ
jgi:Peptidase family M28